MRKVDGGGWGAPAGAAGKGAERASEREVWLEGAGERLVQEGKKREAGGEKQGESELTALRGACGGLRDSQRYLRRTERVSEATQSTRMGWGATAPGEEMARIAESVGGSDVRTEERAEEPRGAFRGRSLSPKGQKCGRECGLQSAEKKRAGGRGKGQKTEVASPPSGKPAAAEELPLALPPGKTAGWRRGDRSAKNDDRQEAPMHGEGGWDAGKREGKREA